MVNISDKESTRRMFDHVGNVNIFVDDSLHQPRAQESLLNVAYDYVRPGGFYFVEDVKPEDACNHYMR